MRAAETLEKATAVVIPVYFASGISLDTAQQLLRETVTAYQRQVRDPSLICLSLDGNSTEEQKVHTLAAETGVSYICTSVNRGKLFAVRTGAGHLLNRSSWRYLAIIDQDGDHFANELLSFIRAIQHVEQCADTDKVMALGRRTSRHRPMGMARGELEELVDRILLDALHYDAVKCSTPLRLEFANAYDEFPDFHSGYKVFTRKTAETVLTGKVQLAGVSDECFFRHACESVMSVEAIKSGAWLVQVNRTTINEQPISTFGLLNRRKLTADMIIWQCKRLGVPGAFVEQWLRNHIPRLLLNTLLPDGRDELLSVMKLVMAAYPDSEKETDNGARYELFKPPFV